MIDLQKLKNPEDLLSIHAEDLLEIPEVTAEQKCTNGRRLPCIHCHMRKADEEDGMEFLRFMWYMVGESCFECDFKGKCKRFTKRDGSPKWGVEDDPFPEEPTVDGFVKPTAGMLEVKEDFTQQEINLAVNSIIIGDAFLDNNSDTENPTPIWKAFAEWTIRSAKEKQELFKK